MSIDRYPGPRSFESSEQTIFRGRTKEIKDLIDLIRLEQVVVLFSQSGLGKSSLLNAGVGPALPAFSFQPVRVRFQVFSLHQSTEYDALDFTPLSSTIEYISNEYNTAYHLLSIQLNEWKEELNKLPSDFDDQQAKQLVKLDRVIQEQLESLSSEQPLTDEKLDEFKKKQREVSKKSSFESDRRNTLIAAIEAGEASMSHANYKQGKYIPIKTTDPFGKSTGGRLWETLKLHPFPYDAIPVFFFDQFEEFFAASDDAKRDFLIQLAEVLCDQPPNRISKLVAEELSQINSLNQLKEAKKARIAELVSWSRQPTVKCVFAIRDDRLSEIDTLENFIPLVLKNRYRLNPLNGNNARFAIVEPAFANGDFTSPPFSYADQPVPDDKAANTLQLIIDGLSNDKGEIDCTQLQMVCNNIETAVKKELTKANAEKIVFITPEGSNSLRVDKRLVPNEQTIKIFINEFYTTRLNTIGTYAEVKLAGHILENNFVLDGKRIGVDKPILLRILNGKDSLINKLVESRLIRPEPTSRGIAYELSHDKLVEPVEQSKRARQRRLAMYSFIGVIVALLIAILTIVYYFNMNSENLELKNKFEILYSNSINSTANQQYELGKQNLAYRIWTYDIDSTSQIAKHRLFAPFFGQKLAYDDQQNYVAVQYKDDSISVFERAKDSMYHKIKLPNSIKKPNKFNIEGINMILFSTKDSTLEIINLISKSIILKLQSKKLSKSINKLYKFESATLAPKGSYMTILDTLYFPHLFYLLPNEVRKIKSINNIKSKFLSKIKEPKNTTFF
jgi:hypothetical protein